MTVEEVYAALWAAYQANGYIKKDGENAFKKTFASGLSKLAVDASKPLPPPKERQKPGGDGKRVSGPDNATGAEAKGKLRNPVVLPLPQK